jgi:hypothetical protein
MSQLTWSTINGYFDLDDTVLDPDQPVTDDLLKKMNHNAKAGAVRCEIIYMGFYKHGNTVGVPSSPVDGYAYSRSEITYLWTEYSNRTPAGGFTPGQATPPALNSSNGGGGYVQFFSIDINDSTGVVSISREYHVQDGGSTSTTDGTIKAWALCQRQSVNQAN